jgi:hypothetical protein
MRFILLTSILSAATGADRQAVGRAQPAAGLRRRVGQGERLRPTGILSITPSRFVAVNGPLKRIIMSAFGLPAYRIVGDLTGSTTNDSTLTPSHQQTCSNSCGHARIALGLACVRWTRSARRRFRTPVAMPYAAGTESFRGDRHAVERDAPRFAQRRRQTACRGQDVAYRTVRRHDRMDDSHDITAKSGRSAH